MQANPHLKYARKPKLTKDQEKLIDLAEEIAEMRTYQLWNKPEMRGVLAHCDTLTFPEDGGLFLHGKGYLERDSGNFLINGFKDAAIPGELIDTESLTPLKTGSEIRFPVRFNAPALKVIRSK